MRFLIGVFVGAIGILVGGYVLATSGRINVAATQHGGWNDKIDHWLDQVSTRSIEKHASSATNPFARDPEAAAAGLSHYKENCLDCHGARTVDAAEFAKGLNPAPPMLDMDDTQKWPDGQLFWVISNGIRASGMPAFSPTHNPQEIWKIVAFVRHLPKLTDEEVARLKAGRENREEHEKRNEAPAAKPAK